MSDRRQLPTAEWCKHHLGRAFEGEDGLYHLQYVTYRDVLLDMGYIDNKQALALDRYALAHYISTLHLATKTVKLGEVMRSAEITADDLPSLRDMHRYVQRHLTEPQAALLNSIVSDIPPDTNIFSVRYAMTTLAPGIERIATHVVAAVEKFDDRVESLLHHSPELC